MFFVNLPIGVAVLAIVALRMVNLGDPHALRLDFAGLVTFSGFLFLLVFALLRGNDEGWSSSLILSLLATSAVLLAAFVAVAVFPYLTLYLQNLLGLSPLQGGLRLLPATVPVFVVPILARRVASRVPAGVLLGTGLAIITGGLVWMSRLETGSHWTALLPGLILAGIGIGLANPSIAHIALAVVPPNRSGMASGISNTFRIGGLACGVAGLGAVFQHQVQTKLPRGEHGLVGALVSEGPQAAAARLPSSARAQFVNAARFAFVSGRTRLLLVGAAAVALGTLAAFTLVRSRDLVPAQAPPPQAAQAAEPAP